MNSAKRDERRADPHGEVSAMNAHGKRRQARRSAMSERRAARADDVHRVGARHVRRRELGVPLRAAVVRRARVPSSFQPSTGPTARGRAAAAAAAARASCASGARRSSATTPSTPATMNCTGNDAPSQRRDAADREGEADGEQVEGAGHELGADQHRRQRSTRSSSRPSVPLRAPRRFRSP